MRRPERSTSSSTVASEYFDRELECRIKTFTTMFEPIMIVFVGVIVGFVAVALVSAMYGVLDGVRTTPESERRHDRAGRD